MSRRTYLPLVAAVLVAWIAQFIGESPLCGLAPFVMTGMTDYADIATDVVTDVKETFKRVYLMAVDAIPDDD